MPARSVYLIRSPGPLWDGLRAAVAALPDGMIIGETARASEARRVAPRLRPDAIVSGIDVGDESAVPVLTELRAHLPDAIIVLFAGRYVADELIGLAAIHAGGYFVWDDLADPTFPAALDAVLSGTFFVTSRLAASAFIDAVLSPRPAGDGIQLTERERAILHHLAAAMTHEQIAAAEGVSVRTVERDLHNLSDKLDAPTAFVLAMKATSYGFIP